MFKTFSNDHKKLVEVTYICCYTSKLLLIAFRLVSQSPKLSESSGGTYVPHSSKHATITMHP